LLAATVVADIRRYWKKPACSPYGSLFAIIMTKANTKPTTREISTRNKELEK